MQYVYLDLETFYPYPGTPGYENVPQPVTVDLATLRRRQKRGLAHPWAKDCRRCALRFLTLQPGDDLLITHDMINGPIPGTLRDLIATHTLVGHNLDFDVNVLRRYGVRVSSSIRDTMLAARLLGLGKEKGSDFASCAVILDDEEIDGIENEPLDNPADNALDTVVARYLGIKIPKAIAKLGNSDWSVSPISELQEQYIRWDVEHLPALWGQLETELEAAKLSACFAERMQFFVNLHLIKMTGVPINPAIRDADRQETAKLKETKREEIRQMFADYRAPVPKSRQKKAKAVKINGGAPVISAPETLTEEFNPNAPTQVVAALALHSIQVENAQKETLQQIKAPETKLLLEYAEHKARLSAIDGIVRSTFPDNRVRAAGWNQLSARTGRITSVEPNLQNLPRAWRHAFQAPPPFYWLTVDLSQIEVYVIAIHTGCQRMISILRDGKDIYVETAAHIFGLEPVRGPAPGQVTELYRDAAKPLVLGINYGLTVYGFIRQVHYMTGLEFTLEEAKEFFELFFELYPEIKAYHDHTLEEAQYADETRTLLDQRRFLPPLKDDRDERTGYWPSLEYRKRILLNTPIQSGACILLIGAVNWFLPRLPVSVQSINLVHDEYNGLATKELLLPTYQLITEGFERTFKRFYGERLSVKVSGYAGRSWAEKNKLEDFLATV
jgi:DNA polymerase I-like protein with 3'-5' exonuclease and polymerase domains